MNPSSVDSISGATVTLTLDYAPPATNPLRDEWEHPAAPGFGEQSVCEAKLKKIIKNSWLRDICREK